MMLLHIYFDASHHKKCVCSYLDTSHHEKHARPEVRVLREVAEE